MAKNIIVVIGRRKVGKSLAAEMLTAYFKNYTLISPEKHLRKEFLAALDMPVEQFLHRANYEDNKNYMHIFKEHQDAKQPLRYLNQFLADVDSLDNCIVDNVYYFNELNALVKMKAKIFFIDAADKKRDEIGYSLSMDKQSYTQEVASITSNQVSNWRNTTIIANNSSVENLGYLLRSQL